MNIFKKTTTLTLIIILLSNLGWSEIENPSIDKKSTTLVESSSIFGLLSSENIQEITIKTDITHLLESKENKKSKYQPATFSFFDKNGKRWHSIIKIRPRGNARKTHCYFPPLKLKFSKKKLQEQNLDSTFNTLKLVSHCEKTNDIDMLMREYLIYKMFNLLTPKSYQIKLLAINYVDTGEKLDPTTHYAFFIENTKEMKARINGTAIKRARLKLNDFQTPETALMDLFQFMIGNSDYNVLGLHNLNIVDVDRFVFPIPYDFDLSGLVNASYALPSEGLPIKNIQERIFTGFCQTDINWKKAIQVFQNKREAIFALINKNKILSSDSKEYMSKYIQSFYGILDDPIKVEEQIKTICEKDNVDK